MKKQSFTLIELLTVIAIIAILAGLLMPALGKARAKAQEIDYIGHIKQLMTTAVMYSGDYGQRLPINIGDDNKPKDSAITSLGAPSALNNKSWVGQLYGLVSEPKIFICNNADEASGFDASKANVSYSYMYPVARLKVTKLTSASSAIYLMDNNKTADEASQICGDSNGTKRANILSNILNDIDETKTNGLRYGAAHQGRVNVGFVDAHAVTMDKNEVKSFAGDTYSGNFIE